jgi:hypothetical protein
MAKKCSEKTIFAKKSEEILAAMSITEIWIIQVILVFSLLDFQLPQDMLAKPVPR